MTGYLLAMLTQTGLYALLALSLNLQWGYTGLLNFGQVGFFACGAYAYAITTGMLSWHPVAGFIAAVVAAALVAFPIGVASIRLRLPFYLAIATLGFSEMVRAVLTNESWLTNGTRGLPVRFFVPGLAPFSNQIVMLAIVVLAVAFVFILLERLGSSPFGRTIEAIRDNEDAARSLGKDVAFYKIKVFMLGAAIAGGAGALNAVYVGYLVPDQFLPIVTFYIWMAMVIGGSGSNRGAILGSALLVFFLEGSRFLKDFMPPELALSDARMAAVRYLAIGAILTLVPLYWPRGLLGRKGF
ncbi:MULTISPECIES: branched-chain amino acid ABC transporter permease [Alphaproteobacteria]|uniref:Branched-chain amino acid ABC transporter permease n=2 Tax=Alphaproteobacteria TaxID=28211 RepID=A0A512HPK4_9HYPH|nr:MULTISPECIES: branched-chain amino acid ABC transporter permease [Alphaproteobacteria]GEO87377.1 branched-chain amino acid ABC transporter permease [Ciceribacter naphthalenivorans]GLR23108.1 branched-chain amino acid ABC transporter permease [Ciceribacter naphthalenivorans]GLT05964.1 branched-chain amino acid ABC transporter permease [Sphingomonas psychrolutea]